MLDLRNNPGGLVTAALETASLFLNPDKASSPCAAATSPRRSEGAGDRHPVRFQAGGADERKSASASEIVTGALQDHDRATIIGESSYGKGLGTDVFPLSEGTGWRSPPRSITRPAAAPSRSRLNADSLLAPPPPIPTPRADFHTDKGRVVKGGGGIQPDFVV